MSMVIVKGNGQFWGEFGTSHCNQWGPGGTRSSQITLGGLVKMSGITLGVAYDWAETWQQSCVACVTSVSPYVDIS